MPEEPCNFSDREHWHGKKRISKKVSVACCARGIHNVQKTCNNRAVHGGGSCCFHNECTSAGGSTAGCYSFSNSHKTYSYCRLFHHFTWRVAYRHRDG